MFALQLNEVLLDQIRASHLGGWEEATCLRFLDSLDEHLCINQNIPWDNYTQQNKYNVPLLISYSQWMYFNKYITYCHGSWSFYHFKALWLIIASEAILEGFQFSSTQHNSNPKKQKLPPGVNLNPLRVKLDFRHFALLFFLQMCKASSSGNTYSHIGYSHPNAVDSSYISDHVSSPLSPRRRSSHSYFYSTPESYNATLRPLPSSKKNSLLMTKTQLSPPFLQLSPLGSRTPKKSTLRTSFSCPPLTSSISQKDIAQKNSNNYLCGVKFFTEKLPIFLRLIHRHYLSDINHVIPTYLEMLSIIVKPIALLNDYTTGSQPTLAKILSGCSSHNSTLGDVWSASLVQQYLLRSLFRLSQVPEVISRSNLSVLRWTHMVEGQREKTLIYDSINSNLQKSDQSPNANHDAQYLFADYPSMSFNEVYESQIYIFDKLRHLKVQSSCAIRIVAPAVAGLVVIQCCSDIEIMTTCRCIKIENSSKVRLHLYSMTQPILAGTTSHVAIGPYNVLFSRQKLFMTDSFLWNPRRLLSTWSRPLVPDKTLLSHPDKSTCSLLYKDHQSNKQSPEKSNYFSKRSKNCDYRDQNSTLNLFDKENTLSRTDVLSKHESSSTCYSLISPVLFRTFSMCENYLLHKEPLDVKCVLLLPHSYAVIFKHHQQQVKRIIEQIHRLCTSNNIDVAQCFLASIRERFMKWLLQSGYLKELENIRRMKSIASFNGC